MENYLINKNTYALIPTYVGTKIICKEGIFFTNENVNNIVNRSCIFYGSTLNGRISACREILGVRYKVPIMVSELNNIILIPTAAIRNDDCGWLNLYAVDNYYKKNDDLVEIIFKDNQKLVLRLSFCILDNQILKASRLDNIIRGRKDY